MAQKATATKTALEPVSARSVESKSVFEEFDRLYNAIARRAFELFESNGRNSGNELDDWLRAESEFLHPVKLNITESGDALAIEAQIDAIYNPSTGIPRALAGGTRLVDNGDGTVTDNATGLMWERKDSVNGGTNYNDPHDTDNGYVWTTFGNTSGTAAVGTVFTDFLARLNDHTAGCFAGQCDWRLPTVAELQTIILRAPCFVDPCIDQTIFGPTQDTKYWSSTTSAEFSNDVWTVDFSFDPGPVVDLKSVVNFARAVRGGSQCALNGRC